MRKKFLLESLQQSVQTLQDENEKLKAELAASPADSPLVTNKFTSHNDKPWASTDVSKMSKRERFLYNLNK